VDQALIDGIEIPPHVPPHLVRPFAFEALPGSDSDSIKAVVEAVRGGPDIFYGLGARRGVGAWVVTRHELIREVFQDAATFSSHHNADFSALLGEPDGGPLLPPIALTASCASCRCATEEHPTRQSVVMHSPIVLIHIDMDSSFGMVERLAGILNPFADKLGRLRCAETQCRNGNRSHRTSTFGCW